MLVRVWKIQGNCSGMTDLSQHLNSSTLLSWCVPELPFHDVNILKVLNPHLSPCLCNLSAASGFTSYLIQPDPTFIPSILLLPRQLNSLVLWKVSYEVHSESIQPPASLIYEHLERKKITRLSKINVSNGYLQG